MIVSAFVGVISFGASAAETVVFDVDTFGLNKTGTSEKIDFRANPAVYEVGDGYNVIWVTTFKGTGYIKYTYEGKEYTFEVLDAIEFEMGRYLALLPVYDDPQQQLEDSGELVIVKVGEENGEEYFYEIEDDDEYETVADAFVDRLQDLFEIDEK